MSKEIVIGVYFASNNQQIVITQSTENGEIKEYIFESGKHRVLKYGDVYE